MVLRIVSETSDQDLAREAAKEDIARALREFAANLIRVTRGAGRPYQLTGQSVEFIKAVRAYNDAVGEWPATDDLSQMLDYEQIWTEHRPASTAPYDDVEMARDQICRAALQIVASKLLGQNTQKVRAQHDLAEGVREYGRAIEAVNKALRKRWHGAEGGSAYEELKTLLARSKPKRKAASKSPPKRRARKRAPGRRDDQ